VQVTITTLSEVQQQAVIHLNHEELLPHFELAYQKFRPTVELKGFRKGKVPMPMIKQLYGEAVENEALDTIASEFYRRAMEEKNIQPIGTPSMVDMDFKRGEHFHFTINFEVKPSFTLGKYKGIEVTGPVHQITEKEVEAEIMNIRRANSTMTAAAFAVDEDHLVTADVQELDEGGTPLIGKKSPNARFLLSDESLAPEIRAGLLNAGIGTARTLKFESKHGEHTHPMHLSMTVTNVEKVTLPPFDDALVVKITGGKVATASEFVTTLRNDIAKYWEDRANNTLNDNIAKAIVEAHAFPVPEALVESLLDSFVEDVKQRARDRKLPRGFDEKKFREESRSYALWQARWMLLKEQIAAAEKLEVTDAELVELATAESAKVGVDRERMIQFYRNSSGATDRLLSDKVMAFLRSNAKITETADDTHEHS
jgi:trigger factor